MITKTAYNNFFNSVKEKLSNKDKLSKRLVETLAKTFGITDKNTIKEITENAIVTIARKIANQPNKSVREKYNEIVALYNSQVNLSQRTSQSMLLQQYSTPATLGYLMGVYCGVDKKGNYLEPSAGNGMLTIANTGKDFTVNEIDKVRYENLQYQNVFKKITKQDASEDIFKSKSFDAVLSNPPFASLKDKEDWLTVGGYTIKHLDHKMAINALKGLKDTGKSAIIVGGHTKWDAKGRIQAGKNRIFLSYLYKHYNVEDVILIDGHALYSKMGTAFNTRIILINGRKEKPSGFAPLKNDKLATVIDNTDDLFKRFSENFENSLKSEKKYTVGDIFSYKKNNATYYLIIKELSESEDDIKVSDLSSLDIDYGLWQFKNKNLQKRTSQKELKNEFGYNFKDIEKLAKKGFLEPKSYYFRNGEYFVKSSFWKQSENGKRARYLIEEANKNITKKMSLLEKINKIKAQQKALLKNAPEGLGMPYIPASQSCFTLNVDTPDSMSFEIHNAIKKIKAAVGGSLNDYLVKKLKYPNEAALCKALAAEQIDGVATAIYNIEEKRQGIIIGDQTGIGKGRQAASIVRYAHKNGMLPIFLTEKPNLFTDLYRDLEDISTAELLPFIVNAKSTKTNIKNNAGKVIIQAPDKAKQNRAFEKGIVPNDYDFVCATYSQFASSKPTLKQSWLRKIVFNKKCIVIMDESHNASGSSATGEFLKDIVKQSVSTIFLSATFAKRPDNMPIYALKTSIQDANMSDENLVDAITNGGVALQEVLASQLVLEGQMIRRERSYNGIQVNYLTLDRLKEKHIKIADAITDIIRRMIGFQATYVDDMVEQLDKIAVAENKEVEVTKGTQSAGVDNTPYFSRVFNVINQMLFSIKADEVANLCIQRLQEGMKPVIAFSNTMGAFIDDEPIDTIIEADFKEVLKRGLESVTSYTTTDDAGNKVKAYFSPSEMDQEARANYYDILDRIEKVSTGIVVSPIDHIVQKIEKAGYKTAEVTGRKKMVQLNYTKNGIVGEIQVRKKINTNDAFRDFNNNEVDVLLINQSGSTGASAHAIPTKKVPESEVKPRVMIVLQAELNINTEVQKRGRINRTGQILKPQYDYVASAIPAEQRLQMMLQKKLKSLDANTTSNQKNSEDLLKSDDFLNKYGDEIVKTWLEENPEMNRLLGNIITEDTKNFTNLAHKTSGRVAILPVVEQERFYKTILDQYHTELQRLIQTGQYDLEVENVNLEAETLEKKVVVVGKTSNSIFGGNTYLEKCEVNNLSKPFTKVEIIELLEANNYKNAITTRDKMVEKYDTYVEGELAKIFVAKSEKWEKVKKNITKEKGYDKANDQQQYYNARVDAIEKALEDDIENAKAKFKNQSDMIRRFLKFFVIGKGVKVPLASYGSGSELIDGVVLNVSFNENADNPFTPSNITFSIAVANSNRRIDLKASGKFQQDINGIISQSYYLNEQRSQNILDNWDLSSKESNVNRRRAYIVTGNILQGYAKYDKGKLVSYTLKGGGITKGILMPTNWQPNSSFGSSDNSVNVPIYKALKFVLSTSTGGVIRTNTPLTLQRYYGSVRLYTPASRKQGGKFYLDENILALTQENNFEKIGNKMTAYVDNDNIPELLKILQDAHGVSALVPQTRVDEIEAITEAINDAKKLEVKTNNSSKAKQLKLKAKMVIALQKQLLIAS